MGAWLYQWDNGDVSLVVATSRDEAVFVLDEFAEADPKRLVPVTGVAIDFPITKNGKSFKTGDLTGDLSGKILDLVDDYTKSGKREKFKKEMEEHDPSVCPAPPPILTKEDLDPQVKG